MEGVPIVIGRGIICLCTLMLMRISMFIPFLIRTRMCIRIPIRISTPTSTHIHTHIHTQFTSDYASTTPYS